MSPARLLVLLALAGCGQGNDPPKVCSTADSWTDGEEGSPLMRPGDDCISCHVDSDGPNFEVAGTVMKGRNDDTFCNGVAGVIVRITDAKDRVVELRTNAAGNFFRVIGEGEPIETPYHVEIEGDGRIRKMTKGTTDTNCVACHTAQGKNDAPGRILVP